MYRILNRLPAWIERQADLIDSMSAAEVLDVLSPETRHTGEAMTDEQILAALDRRFYARLAECGIVPPICPNGPPPHP